MGETTCLMQPFSYTAGVADEDSEGNSVYALGQSVSFGRFMTESLSWEKWSTFSHNRYVEEAEKFSRPGSVAQKKAFFEAHYKSMAARKAAAAAAAAAAVVEQEKNTAAANTTVAAEAEHGGVVHDDTTQDSQIVNTSAIDGEEVHVEEINNGVDGFVGDMEKCETNKVVEVVTENPVVVENCVKVEPLTPIGVVDDKEEVKEMELSGTKQMEKPLLKDFISDKEDLAPVTKKKASFSCSRSLIYGRGTKMPASPAKPGGSVLRTKKEKADTPISKTKVPSSPAKLVSVLRTRKENNATPTSKSKVLPSPAKPSSILRGRKENNATPISKKPAPAPAPAPDSVDKRKSTPKSTHKSMNFTPVRELNRFTSTIIRKIDNSRVGSHSKASKDCPTPQRTPLTASILGEAKLPLATPLSESRRAQTPLHPLASGSKAVRSKWHFLPTDCSKFMSACRNKSHSPNLSAPFSLRTEERAARRKEKLEEKFNANQVQKVQMQSTLKEKAETELKKLRQNLCFKARPLPDFYKERASKNQMEKVPLRVSESPKPGRTPTPTKVQCISQLPQRSSSIKNGDAAGKKSENPRSLASRLRAAHENTSPNIQQ